MPPASPTDPLLVQIQLQLDQIDQFIAQLNNALSQVANDFVNQVRSELNKDSELPEGPNNTTEKKQEKENQERMQKSLGAMQAATDKIAEGGITLVKSVFGLVEQIYERIKQASPLLTAVERLFNLVWTLFFMPLGNKLGEILIPAVIQMMDQVMEIWDAFEGMTIGEMFAYAVEYGVILLSDFLLEIGGLLTEQSGFVGEIGNFLVTMGEFIRDQGENLLETILKIAGWVLTHLGEIISAIIAFKVISTGLQLTQIMVTAAAAAPIVGSLTAGTVAGIGIAGVFASVGAGAAVGGIMNDYIFAAEGAHVPPTPGGQLAVVAEGGEGEWIIPDSKMDSMGRSTYNINIYSYSTDELKRVVKDIVAGEISKSRLRSGF